MNSTRLHAWKPGAWYSYQGTRLGASMGPRVFTRGNPVLRKAFWPSWFSFNGATRLHAWKPRLATFASRAASSLQWGHASSRVETARTRATPEENKMASMGPRVFTRGNRKMHIPDVRSPEASMGPRVFTRGNAVRSITSTTRYSASMGPRVFTRGNDALPALSKANTQSASMGPRVFTRGNCE